MKFKRIDIASGSTGFPTGTDLSLRVQRAQYIVRKIAEALISMDIGWGLDTSRNATVNDFVSVPPKNGSDNMPGLFLRNSVSGCKLFMCYFASTVRYSISEFGGGHFFDNFLEGDLYRTAIGGLTGLIMSMICGGSDQEFGSSFDSSFIPSDATPLIATMTPTTTYVDYQYTVGGSPERNTVYTFGVFADAYNIAIYVGSGSTTPKVYTPTYWVGRFIGSLAQSTDTGNNSRYGVILFRDSTRNLYHGHKPCEATASLAYYSDTNILGDTSNYSKIGWNPTINPLDNYSSAQCYLCFSRADGTWINGGNTVYHASYCPAETIQTSLRLFDTANGSRCRWTPMSLWCASTDLTNYGVVSGDGFKGYADTSLIRYSNASYNQLLDNGNFICLGNQLLISWDASNDNIA